MKLLLSKTLANTGTDTQFHVIATEVLDSDGDLVMIWKSKQRQIQTLTGAELASTAKGVKVYATGTALLAGTADYAGQPAVALDGAFGIPRTTVPGAANNVTIHIAAQIIEPFGAYVDNSLVLKNNTGGYSAVTLQRSVDNVPSGTFGLGPVGNTTYPGVFIASNPVANAADPPEPIEICMEQLDTDAVYRQHRRLRFLGNKRIVLYDWTDGANIGGEALSIEADGRVTIAKIGQVTLVPGFIGSNNSLVCDGTHAYYIDGTGASHQLD